LGFTADCLSSTINTRKACSGCRDFSKQIPKKKAPDWIVQPGVDVNAFYGTRDRYPMSLII
jgi:hypothetical protein